MLITRRAPSTARQATTFTRATSLVPRPSQPVAAHPATPVRGACAAACASGTFSGVTLGAECGYSTTKSALVKCAAACQYVQPDFTVSANMAEVMKTPGSVFSGAYYHKVSGEMQVGAEIKKAASKSDVDLAFGCLYKLDKTTTVKGKVDSDGKLFASFKQQLSPLTLLTLVSEVDTVNLNEGKHKFGMAMSLTP